MLNAILGSKGKMGQTFIEGFRIPVTSVVAGDCVVTQIKSKDKDGYWAVQLGFGQKKAKNVTKPLQGHLSPSHKTTGNETSKKFSRYLREIRLEEKPELNVGDIVKASDIFKPGDVVWVTGTSKGKGFAGVVKRWGFAGGPRTHGQSDRERAPGSIGQTTTPGRIYKGKKMAGKMGAKRVTLRNLHVVSVNPETNEILVSGSIPGNIGSLLILKKVASGSLSELERETVTTQVVEGEAPAEGETKEGEVPTEKVEEKVPSVEENKNA